VPEVVQAAVRARLPTANVDPVLLCQQAGFPNVLLAGPPRRPMEVVSVFHQLACSAVRHHEKSGHTENASDEHDHFALEERVSDSKVARHRVVPAPNHPCKWLIEPAAMRAQ